jgi:hypothetical protein
VSYSSKQEEQITIHVTKNPKNTVQLSYLNHLLILHKFKRTQYKPRPPKYSIQPESKTLVALWPTSRGPKETPYIEKNGINHIHGVHHPQHTQTGSN